jgi:hypothetical protein
MTPVKVPTVPCADPAPGQNTAATNAAVAKDDFDMLNLPHALGDQPQTESLDANDPVPYLELGRTTHGASQTAAAGYLKRHSKARERREHRDCSWRELP